MFTEENMKHILLKYLCYPDLKAMFFSPAPKIPGCLRGEGEA